VCYRGNVRISIGLPILECPEAVTGTDAGQTLEVELETGTIRNQDTGQAFQAAPYPPFMMDIISAGGLIEFTRKELKK
jgi:3-isopropylmalate/(R)-2-methylmalate dehydratase small subunit